MYESIITIRHNVDQTVSFQQETIFFIAVKEVDEIKRVARKWNISRKKEASGAEARFGI